MKQVLSPSVWIIILIAGLSVFSETVGSAHSLRDNIMSNHPLTAPLPARQGESVITPEYLLNLSQKELYPLLKWLDNTHLLYNVPPLNNTKSPTIGLLDVCTGKNIVLGKGSYPKLSPDGQWIAFIQGEKEKKQLWILRVLIGGSSHIFRGVLVSLIDILSILPGLLTHRKLHSVMYHIFLTGKKNQDQAP